MKIRAIVTAIGAAIAVVTAISPPAAYFVAGYASLSQRLSFEAELNAGHLAKYINSHSGLWQFQSVRIAELLSQTDSIDSNFLKRVVDASGKTVVTEGDRQMEPSTARFRPVKVAGVTVAEVELGASLLPLLRSSLLVALFSSLLGLGVFIVLRVFPLRVLDRTLGELERSNRDLAQTNERFKGALTHMSHGLSMFDIDGRLVVGNDRFIAMYDLPRDIERNDTTIRDLLRRRVRQGFFSGDPDMSDQDLLDHLRLGAPKARMLAVSGKRSIAVISHALPTGGWVSTHEDVTEKLAADARISHMALHDALTGLPNRTALHQHLEDRIHHLAPDQKLAVLFLDLDHFKNVNDALGHPVGDSLLREVATRARGCLRDGEMLARLGGDEFVIVHTQVDHIEDVNALAARLIDGIGAPFDLEGHQVTIGVSLGIALAPRDAACPDDLLRNADMALYRAKADGKNTCRFFEPEMDRLMRVRRTLELDLRKAVGNSEFVLHYQPILHLQSEEVCGFEALVRWNHPVRGLISPLDFIPFAEETDLIMPIGEWVFRTACLEAATWPRHIKVAVNLSPSQFKKQNIVAMVVSALAHSGLEAGRLELEITESVLLFDNPATLATLRQIKDLGVRIAIDDFGTGYSSLSYLRSFPFDKIKIDRSFVHDVDRQAGSKAILRAITRMGSGLGMTTTAEGVETRAEVDYLRAEGCTEAQGYFFSKPKPANEIRGMIAERNASLSAVG